MNGMIEFITYNYFSEIIQKISGRSQQSSTFLLFFPFCDDNSVLYT